MTEEVMKQKYLELGITEEVYNYGTEIEKTLKERFAKIDEIAEYNQLKVIHAMQKCRVSAECFQSTSGYGYNDIGRDTLEEVYAECFHGEAALVRPQIRWRKSWVSARLRDRWQSMALPIARWIC